ncbi:hypothetical protein HH310_25345 [Actinoplanes sp. TBRC 11911]|uniref:hypothetical protein n=1 Tax=Actinoplanes sp. TBRC 11911 TaxID=2729386 RepID=UPI00145E3627|nr:hypothetical protein [Actinoplanes sp. TBRC 11911]NMO54498.1 hypothetical protein [Actinoplanes sp. TBRC 11911]
MPSPPQPDPLPLALLTGILALTDGALAGIGLVVANARRQGHLTTVEAATFLLVGASAALGVLILVLALLALARGTAGHTLARLASALAWLRLPCVIIALPVLALTLGFAALSGVLQTAGAAVAVADALPAVVVAGILTRRAPRR